MANVNGSNKITDAVMTAEAAKLGTAYGEGKDAWPMLFQKFASWGQEGAVPADTASATKGTDDKVKALVADFIKAAGKAQTLSTSTITNKETEMRVAVELGVYCSKAKVDAVKLISNVRDACHANRNGKVKVPTMQTLNAFASIGRRFVDKKLTKLLTTAELQPLVKAPPKKAAPKIAEVWKAEARTLGLLTGIYEPKTSAEKRAFAKKDTDENSVKVAAAVIAYVTKITAPATKADAKK